MDTTLLDELERCHAAQGPAAAVERLIEQLREQKDYASLFYTLLMKKRVELGVNPLPTAPASELPSSVHAAYEEAIRTAARLVCRLYLDEGNIPLAYGYANMLREMEPIKAALDRCQPGDGEDLQQLVQIAFYEGAHPRKGFDWVLTRYGICNAITTYSQYDFSNMLDVRQYCVERLVRALYEELRERLVADVERREGQAPACAPGRGAVRQLIRDHGSLFDDDCYHIDTSHLSSVVQMSLSLPRGEELELARELCEYGQRLPSHLQYPGNPPFEEQYRDIAVYLAALAGEDVEQGIAHFTAKAENADPETVGTFPAEVLVNLLIKLGRDADALAVARRFLTHADSRRLSCPTIGELCQKVKDYRVLADAARQVGDPIHFLAGLIAAGKQQG